MYSSEATKKQIKYVLNNLRDEDKQELIAKYGDSWKKKTYNSIRLSDTRVGYFDNKIPALVFGVASTEIPSRKLGGYGKEYAGTIWMLATQAVDRERISFLRQAKQYVQESLKTHVVLCNVIFKENKTAIKWLEWLGFEFSPYTEDFLFFYKRSN